MNSKSYEEQAIEEITTMIKDNLILQYKYRDDRLRDLREYCRLRKEGPYQFIAYNDLIYLTKEAIKDLITSEYLYDLRTLE